MNTGLKALLGGLRWLPLGCPGLVPNPPELDVTLVLTIADRCHSVGCLGWSGGLGG